MAVKQVCGVARITIYQPEAAGRVQENSTLHLPQFGFCRNVGFLDRRRSHPYDSPAPESDPAEDYAQTHYIRCQPALSTNAIVCDVQPDCRDMDPGAVDIHGGLASQVITTHPIEALNRQWFCAPKAQQGTGQNRWSGGMANAPGGSYTPEPGGVASFDSEQTAANRDTLAATTTFSLDANQGWELDTFTQDTPGLVLLFLLTISTALAALNPLFAFLATMSTAGALLAMVNDLEYGSHCYVHWGIGSTQQWFLLMPDVGMGRHTAWLLKSTDSGATWNILDTHSYEAKSDQVWQSYGLGLYARRVTFRIEGGCALIDTGHGYPVWRVTDPNDPNGFTSPAGRAQVGFYSSSPQWCFNGLKRVTAPTVAGTGSPGVVSAYAMSGPFVDPPYVNMSGGALSLRVYPRDGLGNQDTTTADTTVTASLVTDGVNPNAYWVKVQWNETGTYGQQAVPIMGVQVLRQAAVEAPVTLVGDASTDCESVSWTINRWGKGGSASIRLKNDHGQWSNLQRNELVTIEVAQVTYDLTALTTTQGAWQTVFVGMIDEGIHKEDAVEYAGTPGIVELQLKDFISGRLTAKRMIDKPAFGGWPLGAALALIMRDAGFYGPIVDPANSTTWVGTYYDFSTVDSGFVLPSTAVKQGGKGQLSFYYQAQTGVIQAMNEMCNACQFDWGLGPGCVIKAWPVAAPDTTGGISLNDSAILADTDSVCSLEVKRKAGGITTIVAVHAKDKSGADIEQRAWQHDAMYGTYGSSTNYVGDDRWHVDHAPAGSNPLTVAIAEMGAQSAHADELQWKSKDFAHLAAWCRKQVTLNIVNQDVEAGAIYQVMEMHGSLGQDLESEMTFILGRPIPAASGGGTTS